MPTYGPQQMSFLAGVTGQHLYSRPQTKSYREDYYKEQEAELGWAVDQAATRGMISHEAAEEAKVANDRTWWDKAWGFEESSETLTGRFAQGIVDVLSLGNYAAAATTKATIDDPLVQIGSLKIGATPSAWMKAFRERPYYSDMTDSFWGGLAFDIALDPMTYLTFGVGAGTKVGVQGITKVGARELAKGTQKLTLTRHGQDIYNLAARKMRPIVEDAVKASSDAAVANGGAPSRLLDEQFLFRFHDMVGKYMVDQYDVLALEHGKNATRWEGFKKSVRGAIDKPGDALVSSLRQGDNTPFMSQTAEDMFQETARAQQKEIGINFTNAGKAISNIPVVGKAFKAVAPNFHRKLGVPVDVQDRWFVTKGNVERATAKSTAEIQDALGHLSADELNLVTRVIDTGEEGISRTWDEGQQTMTAVLEKDGTFLDPKIQEAVKWTRERFENIAKNEDAAGHTIERLQDYVHRVYKTRDARQVAMARLDRHEGISNFAQLGGFQMHRAIASLDDAIEVMGTGGIEQNIGAIITKREAASVRMIEMEKFYDYVKSTSGIASLMVYQAGNEGKRTASFLSKILRTERPSENRIYDFDQLYAMPDRMSKRLGFVTDENAFKSGGAGKNLNMLRYLSLETTDRLGEAGAKLSAELRPNGVAQATNKFNRSIDYRGEKIDVIDLLGNDYDNGVDILNQVAGRLGKLNSEVTADDLALVLRRLDTHFRDELDTPLLHLFPDIVDKVKGAAGRSAKLGKRIPGSQTVPNKAIATETAKRTKLKSEIDALQIKNDKEFFDLDDLMNDLLKTGKSNPGYNKRHAAHQSDNFKLENLKAQLKTLDESIAALPKKIPDPSAGGRTLKTGTDKVFKTLHNTLRKEIETTATHVPQLPEEFILRANVARMRYGDMTDIAKISDPQLKRIIEYKTKIGGQLKNGNDLFRAEHLSQVTEALFNKKSLSSLTAREADKLIEFLGVHAGEFTARNGAVSGSLFPGGVRKVTFGQRSKPFFHNQAEDVTFSVAKAEKMALGEIRRKSKMSRMQKQIESGKGTVAAIAKQINETKEKLAKAVGAHDVAKLTDEVMRLESASKKATELVDSVSKAKSTITNPINVPNPKADTRQYIGSEEVLTRNVDTLLESEAAELGRRKGVSRNRRDIRSVLSKEDTAPAFAVRRALNKKVKPLEKELAGIDKMIEQTQEALLKSPNEWKGSVGESLNALLKRQAALGKQIDDAVSAAMKEFETDFKILSGGRYMDDTGKVRDILVRKTGKGKQLQVMGKHADKIRKALVSDMINTGRNEIEYLKPALIDELPDTVIGTAAGSYYLPEDIARFLEEIVTPLYNPASNDMVNGMLRGWDRIQNIFKVPLLAPWMSTMFRNAIGNVSINYMRAGMSLLDPDHLTNFMGMLNYHWAKESKLYRGARGLTGEAGQKKIDELGKQTISYLGDGGKPITFAELTEEFGRRGVTTAWMRDEVFEGAFDQKAGRAMGAAAGLGVGASVGGPVGGLLGFGVGALLGKESYRMRTGFRFQELASEVPTRLMLAIHAFKATGSFDEAGRVVRHFLHDYSELSTFEKRVVRRLIPFYNFTKLATRVVGTQVFEQPGRVMLPHKIFNSQNKTGYGFDEAAMPEDVPDWFHKQMVFLGKDIDEETGQVKTSVFSGFNLPVQEVFQLADILAPGGEPINKLGSRGSFGATSVLEYIANYDTFRGGPIRPDIDAGVKKTAFQSAKQWEASPDWMQSLVGFQTDDEGNQSVNPKVAWALGEIPTSRFIALSKKIYELDEEGAKKTNMNHLASQFLGVNKYRYDPESQQYFKNKRRVDAMTNILANIRVLKSYSIDRSTFNKPDARKSTKVSLPPGLAGNGPITGGNF